MLASCPPFNIDGNFGGGAAIIEMLLQSHETKTMDGEEIPIIELLPALPDDWDKGNIIGFRAVKGFEVDMEWKEGVLVQARIQSLFGHKGLLRYMGKDIPLDLKRGEEFILDPLSSTIWATLPHTGNFAFNFFGVIIFLF